MNPRLKRALALAALAATLGVFMSGCYADGTSTTGQAGYASPPAPAKADTTAAPSGSAADTSLGKP